MRLGKGTIKNQMRNLDMHDMSTSRDLASYHCDDDSVCLIHGHTLCGSSPSLPNELC